MSVTSISRTGQMTPTKDLPTTGAVNTDCKVFLTCENGKLLRQIISCSLSQNANKFMENCKRTTHELKQKATNILEVIETEINELDQKYTTIKNRNAKELLELKSKFDSTVKKLSSKLEELEKNSSSTRKSVGETYKKYNEANQKTIQLVPNPKSERDIYCTASMGNSVIKTLECAIALKIKIPVKKGSDKKTVIPISNDEQHVETGTRLTDYFSKTGSYLKTEYDLLEITVLVAGFVTDVIVDTSSILGFGGGKKAIKISYNIPEYTTSKDKQSYVLSKVVTKTDTISFDNVCIREKAYVVASVASSSCAKFEPQREVQEHEEREEQHGGSKKTLKNKEDSNAQESDYSICE